MLNRTNLTLSALSNRLNLGTRSLVLNASVNNGGTLRIRHAHHDVMRDAMAAFEVGEFVVAYPTPPITDPTTTGTPRPQACAAPSPSVAADSSPRSLQGWQGWLGQSAFSRANQSPSSRLRQAAARAAAFATKPRLDRGTGKVGKVGAAGAAISRAATGAAIAAVAGS